MSFEKVTTQQELWEGEMKSFLVKGKSVLLMKVENDVYAYENRCAHLALPLDNGKLERGMLTCKYHGWCYDAYTGAGINNPAAHLKSFPVKFEGDDILVEVAHEEGHETGRSGPG